MPLLLPFINLRNIVIGTVVLIIVGVATYLVYTYNKAVKQVAKLEVEVANKQATIDVISIERIREKEKFTIERSFIEKQAKEQEAIMNQISSVKTQIKNIPYAVDALNKKLKVDIDEKQKTRISF